MKSKTHYVYMLRCKDKSLYTGYTTNIPRRHKAHNDKTASKYTRSRLPARMVYYQALRTKGSALSCEARLKKLTKVQKEALVEDFNQGFTWIFI